MIDLYLAQADNFCIDKLLQGCKHMHKLAKLGLLITVLIKHLLLRGYGR